MLKNIDPLISPELLSTLARMGHGDTIAVVDNNYPAYAAGVPVIRMDGSNAVDAVAAILTLLPIDYFVEQPVARMAVVNRHSEVPAVAKEVLAEIDEAEGRPRGVEILERFAFYERAKTVSTIVATGETRAYGCFILTKGVIKSDKQPAR